MTVQKLGSWGGMIGVIALSLGLIVTALLYRGDAGQTYSPFNYFVSELGHTAESESWQLFSAALIIGGIGFGLSMVGIASRFIGFMRPLITIGGLLNALCGALVGLFPMDTALQPHGLFALGFFLLSLIVITIFSLYVAFARQTAYPRWLAIVGLPMIASTVVFLLLLFSSMASQGLAALELSQGERADFILLTATEWGVVIFLSAWVVVMAIHLLSRESTPST